MEVGDESPFTATSARCDSGEVLITLRGELDIASAHTLRALLATPDAQAPTIVLDLRAVDFIDSSGLSAIITRQKEAEHAGERLVVATSGALQVQRLIALTGLDDVLEVVDHPDEVIGRQEPTDRV